MSEELSTENIYHNHSDDLDETESTRSSSTSTEDETDDGEQKKSSAESSTEEEEEEEGNDDKESTTSESSADDHDEENKTSESSSEDEDEEKNTNETETTSSSEDEDDNELNYDLSPWFIIVNGNNNYIDENIDEHANNLKKHVKNLLTEVIIRLALELCEDVKITQHLPHNHSASFTSCCFSYDQNNLTVTAYNRIKRVMKDKEISFAILFIGSQTNIVNQNVISKDLPVVKDNANDSELIEQMTKLLSDKIKYGCHK